MDVGYAAPSVELKTSEARSLPRSQTLPRSTRKPKLLVSFDLNASHDLTENTSVVSCPSLRSALRHSSGPTRTTSSTNLSVRDQRRSFWSSKGRSTERLDQIPRSRTWSSDDSSTITPTRSKSLGSTSSRSTENLKLPIRRSQFNGINLDPDTRDYSPGSTHSLLHSYLPKCLSADIVIECAQDRLVELQNQVVEAYRARAEVTQALEEQRRRYKELVDLYEQYRCGTLGPPVSPTSCSTKNLSTAVENMRLVFVCVYVCVGKLD
ncbi:unnamed protein product [Echinostoma caproni]|uniref:Centrosomal protein of 85 kDa-like n=1 Tax=Echinostoma caproni TaxID=27848 RepID=A0A183BEN7_9TREM|nr:unnamed protein product [Echinostoma caproni]